MRYIPNLRVFALAGVLLVVHPAPVFAAAGAATLVLPDLCGGPSNIFDFEWAGLQNNNQRSALFFMGPSGAVSEITDEQKPFNEYEKVYVAAHGSRGRIGGLTYTKFVEHFSAAHPKPPEEVFFATCFSADETATKDGSLLKIMDAKYHNAIGKLTGADSECALTGNDLNAATYKVGVNRENLEDEKKYTSISRSIERKWTGLCPSYKDFCEQATAQFKNQITQTEALAFVNFVLKEFVVPAPLELSTNYLELVRLNKGGKNMTVCGKTAGLNNSSVPCK